MSTDCELTSDQLVTMIKLISSDGQYPPLKDMFAALSVAMKNDKEYAFAWYCNIRMSLIDGGATMEAATASANYLMYACFGVLIDLPT